MTKEELSQLAIKVSEGKASMTELALFNAACEAFQKEEINWPGMEKDLLNMEETSLKQIWAEQGNKGRATAKLWPRVAVAAAAVIGMVVAGAALWFFTHNETVNISIGTDRTAGNDIKPGRNTAELIAYGRTIQLSDEKTGVVIDKKAISYNDGSGIRSAAAGKAYDGDGISPMAAITPRGGTYQITLPDGTNVWLNAESEITFPSQFNGQIRKVLLKGEAYFEVATAYQLVAGRKVKKSFLVETKGQVVDVLGTHFNISAYEGEGIRTTLLEGSVRVASLSASGGEPSLRAQRGQNKIDASSYMSERQRGGGNNNNSSLPTGVSPRGGERMAIVLKPNQQSFVTASSGITIKQVDANEAVAWKNGLFAFTKTPLAVVMRQIERWYNVEVIYSDASIKAESFTGTVSKYDNVSGILSAIEKTGAVKFKVEGRKVLASK